MFFESLTPAPWLLEFSIKSIKWMIRFIRQLVKYCYRHVTIFKPSVVTPRGSVLVSKFQIRAEQSNSVSVSVLYSFWSQQKFSFVKWDEIFSIMSRFLLFWWISINILFLHLHRIYIRELSPDLKLQLTARAWKHNWSVAFMYLYT